MSTPEEAARRILNIDDGVSDEDHHEYLDAVAVARAYLELVQREKEGSALPTAAPQVQDGETKATQHNALSCSDEMWARIKARYAEEGAAVAEAEQVRASARATPSPSAREAQLREALLAAKGVLSYLHQNTFFIDAALAAKE